MAKTLQSPPWIVISYIQDLDDSSTEYSDNANKSITDNNSDNNDDDDGMTMPEGNFHNETKTDGKFSEDNSSKMNRKILVVSGRDDVLLKLLANKMNFKFEYVDVKMMETNVTKSGALGLQMLQSRVSSLKSFKKSFSF